MGINKFVKWQHYGKQADLDAVLPLLDRVVESSPRLTVLIFCDGNEEIHGTPFAAGINQVFKQHRDERQKARQPFVLVLRSQLGSYVGCTMNFPPAPISFPVFPPWPQPTNPPPPVVATDLPPPAPPLAPPLILINTNRQAKPPVPLPNPTVTNRAEPVAQPVLPPTPVVTNQFESVAKPAPPLMLTTTNPTKPVAKPAPEISSNRTATVSAATNPPIAQTNGLTVPIGNSAAMGSNMPVLGAILLVSAGALVILIWRRSRARAHASLITRSIDGNGRSSPPRA